MGRTIVTEKDLQKWQLRRERRLAAEKRAAKTGKWTREKLLEAIAERADMPESQAQKHFDALEEVVTDVLKSGDEVQITGFGKFYVREQKAREGVNPQTKEKLKIPASKVPKFTAGSALKDSIKDRNVPTAEMAERPDRSVDEAGAEAPPKPDDYMNRLLKYIPAETVALYLTLQGIVLSGAADDPNLNTWLWVIFGLGLIGTTLYLWRLPKVRKVAQLAVSTTAFAVWVFAIGGAFASLSWYKPFIGSVVLVVFTFFAPLISPDVLNYKPRSPGSVDGTPPVG